MSAIPITRHRHRTRPGFVPSEPKVVPQDREVPRLPSEEAIASVRARTAFEPVVRHRARPSVMTQVSVFLILVGLSYMVFSVVGQVLLEAQRRAGIEANLRAREARRMEVVLKERLDAVSSLTAVNRWAASRGFVAPDRLADSSGQTGRLARR
ncbi:MAG: hypothetical protein SNJ74_10905 [Fimbriimonadaceae bacterium]